MKPLRKAARSKSFFLLLLIFFIGGICQAQEKVTDYYSPAGKANLATLWHAPKIYFVGAPDPWDTFPEPFGFIGSNYQRFYIHCNWGDFKIPGAGDLDFSVSELMINKNI